MTEPHIPPDVVLPHDLAEEAAELVRLVARLIDGTEDTNRQLERLNRRGRRDRLMLWLIGLALVAVVVLGAGLAWNLRRANDAASVGRHASADLQHITQANGQAIVDGCEANNRTRAAQIALWEGVLGLNTNPDAIARRPAQLDLVHKTFAPRDCSRQALGVQP